MHFLTLRSKSNFVQVAPGKLIANYVSHCAYNVTIKQTPDSDMLQIEDLLSTVTTMVSYSSHKI